MKKRWVLLIVFFIILTGIFTAVKLGQYAIKEGTKLIEGVEKITEEMPQKIQVIKDEGAGYFECINRFETKSGGFLSLIEVSAWMASCGESIPPSQDICLEVLPTGFQDTFKYLGRLEELCKDLIPNVSLTMCKESLQETFAEACANGTSNNVEIPEQIQELPQELPQEQPQEKTE